MAGLLDAFVKEIGVEKIEVVEGTMTKEDEKKWKEKPVDGKQIVFLDKMDDKPGDTTKVFGDGNKSGLGKTVYPEPKVYKTDTYDELLNPNKARYDAKDSEYVKAAKDKIFKLYRPPSRLIDGKQVYDNFYFNEDEMKLRLFCESIGWNEEIVDLLLHPKTHAFRNSICNLEVGTLIYRARGVK